MPRDRSRGDLRSAEEHVHGCKRVASELATADRQVLWLVCPVAADVEQEAVEAGRVEEVRHRQRPVAARLPAVDQHHARAWRPVPRRDEPGRQVEAVDRDDRVLERHAEVVGGRLHLVAAWIAGTRAIGKREPIRQPDLGGGDGGGNAGATSGAHVPKVTARPPHLSSGHHLVAARLQVPIRASRAQNAAQPNGFEEGGITPCNDRSRVPLRRSSAHS